MSGFTTDQLVEWRALCAGPDGAALNVRLMVERGPMLALLDEVLILRAEHAAVTTWVKAIPRHDLDEQAGLAEAWQAAERGMAA